MSDTKIDVSVYKKAETKLHDANKRLGEAYGKVKLSAKNSDIDFADNYVSAVKKLKSVLKSYNKALLQEEKNFTSIRKNLEKIDENAAIACK